MAAATQSRTQPQQRPAQPQVDPARLLDQIIEQKPSERQRIVSGWLDEHIDRIEEVLPDQLKGQARRLAKRALITLARKPDLRDCPPAEFIRCVIEAAEIGLAIDGKLCHVVRYKSVWQVQPDYKGLIAVAKRAGQIVDCYADVVGDGDLFKAERVDGGSHLVHERDLLKRGSIIAAYAVVKLPGGDWRYELMDLDELNAIQRRAPAQNGPWKTDVNEMRKKTVIRRALKLYCDDPAMTRAFEMEDELYEAASGEEGQTGAPPVGRLHYRKNSNGHALPDQPDPPEGEPVLKDPPRATAAQFAALAEFRKDMTYEAEFCETLDRLGCTPEQLTSEAAAEILGRFETHRGNAYGKE